MKSSIPKRNNRQLLHPKNNNNKNGFLMVMPCSEIVFWGRALQKYVYVSEESQQRTMSDINDLSMEGASIDIVRLQSKRW